MVTDETNRVTKFKEFSIEIVRLADELDKLKQELTKEDQEVLKKWVAHF